MIDHSEVFLALRERNMIVCSSPYIASSGFYGTESEEWQEEPSDPGEIVFSAESFETFMCRFWLENEIWFAGYEKKPMPDAGQEYIERYRNGEA